MTLLDDASATAAAYFRFVQAVVDANKALNDVHRVQLRRDFPTLAASLDALTTAHTRILPLGNR